MWRRTNVQSPKFIVMALYRDALRLFEQLPPLIPQSHERYPLLAGTGLKKLVDIFVRRVSLCAERFIGLEAEGG